MHLLILILVSAFLTFTASPLLACLHPPKTYKGTVTELSQQAIVFHHNGREELILKVDYTAKGPAPRSLAWVIPTPKEPDHYAIEDGAIFKELFQFTRPIPRGLRKKQRKSKSAAPQGVTLLAKASVGEYDIQPLKVTGANAGKALNQWLKSNGYGEVARDAMAWYLEHNWTFLAIKILPKSAQKSLKKTGQFRPLRISFASKNIVYPLMFSSHQGVFDVTLYLITNDGFKYPDLVKNTKRFGFRPMIANIPITDHVQLSSIPAFQKLWDKLRDENRLQMTRPAINRLFANQINSPANRLSDWKQDFSLTP